MSKKIILKKGKDTSLRRFHPWIFSGAIQKMDKGVRDGDIVEVRDADNEFLALGHYQQSSISVRVFSFQPVEDRSALWQEKIEQAYALRVLLGLIDQPDTNAYRLIHAEGDELPGLIVDIYRDVAVIQCHSIGMYQAVAHLAEAIKNLYGDRLSAIYNKSKATLPSAFATQVEDGYLQGGTDSCPATITENGIQFLVNWESGQKTGFFLDQRDNRQKIAGFVRDKKVLNAFSYSGGFSLYALRGGAREVHSVDISEKATLLAEQNVQLNDQFSGTHQAITLDVMQYLKDTDESYELMIVDPPAFAKSIKKRHNAVQAYKRLNALAFKKLAPGGILATFSCSQVVSRQLFFDTITSAAIESKRKVKVLERLGQPADHPVSLFHRESSYLKGLILYVS